MRIIGSIEHPTYKITLLEMNARVTIQIEDGDLVQSFRFRDGGMVIDSQSANAFCDEQFMLKVSDTFTSMRANLVETSTRRSSSIENEFDVII